MKESFTDHLKKFVTEQRNPNTIDIDSKSIIEILKIINEEDKMVAAAVEKEIPYIARAVEIVLDAFKSGGRLFYIGAGTSGRLGVLDAAECPPTFGTDPDLIRGIIAGGYKALVAAQEGAEDRKEDSVRDLKKNGVTKADVVCGLAASRQTPYVVAGIGYAKSIGAKTLYVTCTPRKEMDLDVDVAICPVVGPEVIMGSTRMKSGTAQKMVLNMITTTTMIHLGKVFENMMVDLHITSKKLQQRARRTVVMATGVDYDNAAKVLKLAKGHTKTAIVMILSNISFMEARKRLAESNGFVRNAIIINSGR